MMDELAERLSRVLALASSISVLAITIAIVIDVVGRYLWSAPLSGASEFAVTALVAVVFLGLARSQRTGGNFRVDLLIRVLPQSVARTLEILWRVVAAFCIGILSWLAIREAIHSTATGEATFGTVVFPVWPARIILAIGLSFLLLQLVVEIVRIGMGLPPIDEQRNSLSSD
jgi:TRAP-type C4-dicarboxylate transport system permease small subunit